MEKRIRSIIPIVLCLGVLTILFLFKTEVSKEVLLLKEELHGLRSLSFEVLKKKPLLSNAFFSKDAYCGKSSEISFKAFVSSQGEIKFKTKILKESYDGPVPKDGLWWEQRKQLFVELNLSKVGTQTFALEKVFQTEEGKVLSFIIDGLELSLINCKML